MNEPLYCANHPATETYLRCNKCGKPICPKCAVQTPVGYRCRDCINAQQQVFYTGFQPIYYVIATAVALPLSLIAGWIVPNLGWYAIILGPLTGAGIAEAAWWAIQRRRGPYTWLIVCGCIAAGLLLRLLLSLLPSLIIIAGAPQMSLGRYAVNWTMGLIWHAVYLFTAVGAAYARLRPGRRV
ncbi:MAG TPA: hypothetical protein ENN99_00970 [Chloroflexi bacterium]|nr:hypothetical protein [Chloroflexota bacterium]